MKHSGTAVKFEKNPNARISMISFYFRQEIFFDCNFLTFFLQQVVRVDTNDVHRMAVDWVTRKIYFTGQNTKRIEVTNFDGSQRKVLFRKPVGDPFGIALSPRHG